MSIVSCGSISNKQTTTVSKEDHYTVMAGHVKQSTANLSQQLKFFYPNGLPPLIWDVEAVPCPNGWHLPDEKEWDRLHRLLSVNNSDKTKAIHGIEYRSKKLKTALPKTIVKNDTAQIKKRIVRANHSAPKSVLLNLKEKPSEWSSPQHQTTVEAYHALFPNSKPLAYALDTTYRYPKIISYACFCIEDTPESK